MFRMVLLHRMPMQRRFLPPETRKKKVTHFLQADYHLRALCLTGTGVGTTAGYLCGTVTPAVTDFIIPSLPGRTIMAKGQQRKTKEAKKPKKQPVPAKVTGQ